ncbi:MAG: universal stress protein [Halobacteriota archaeon]
MYDSILVPTDGSDTIEGTLSHALHLAATDDATVHGLNVVDKRIVQASSGDLRADVEADLLEQGEHAIAEIEHAAAEAGVDVETAIRTGTPDKEIVEYAAEIDADLIVIGTHGKTPREKLQALGSVSERVVDGSTVPVFVVKRADSDE